MVVHIANKTDRLILPGVAPSVNHMYANAKRGNRRVRVLTPMAQAWFDETVLRTDLWRGRHRWETVNGKIVVRIWYYFPDRKKRDTHNTLKALMDALEAAGVYTDDRYALPHIMDYEVDTKNPRIEIEFEKVEAV